jgi:hypothetical protein
VKSATLGLFAIGFVIVVVRIAHWWIKSKGSRNWKALTPFALSAMAFALAGACVGGLIGTLATWIRNLLGGVGDFALQQGTGTQHVTVSHSAAFGTLNPFGAVFMIGVVAVLVVLFKSARDRLKKEMGWGGTCGIALGPFLGAITLVPLVNSLALATIGRLF